MQLNETSKRVQNSKEPGTNLQMIQNPKLCCCCLRDSAANSLHTLTNHTLWPLLWDELKSAHLTSGHPCMPTAQTNEIIGSTSHGELRR